MVIVNKWAPGTISKSLHQRPIWMHSFLILTPNVNKIITSQMILYINACFLFPLMLNHVKWEFLWEYFQSFLKNYEDEKYFNCVYVIFIMKKILWIFNYSKVKTHQNKNVRVNPCHSLWKKLNNLLSFTRYIWPKKSSKFVCFCLKSAKKHQFCSAFRHFPCEIGKNL